MEILARLNFSVKPILCVLASVLLVLLSITSTTKLLTNSTLTSFYLECSGYT